MRQRKIEAGAPAAKARPKKQKLTPVVRSFGGAPVEITAHVGADAVVPVESDGMETLGVAVHSNDARTYRAGNADVLVVPKQLSPRDRIKLEVRDALIREGRATKHIRDRVIRLAKEYGNVIITDRRAADWCREWLEEFRVAGS
jgi:hypothetical protein